MGELIVGTRGSALALAQTELVCAALRRAHPGLGVRVERITTTGDMRTDVPLSQLGRGIFVTEIETALRERRIDVAVHSAKDMPSVLSGDMAIAAFLPRADARDVLVSPHGGLLDLPRHARVGTSSPRRTCLLRTLRPDAHPLDVRGNVDTRLRKLRSGEYDALILAAAGLIRLGRAQEITEWLDPDRMIPSVGQGALALETRADDRDVIALLRVLDHADTRAAVTAERAFLAELGAGCRAAAGAYAVVEGGALEMSAVIGTPDGTNVRTRRRQDARLAGDLGRSVARQLLRSGGAAFLARPDSPVRGRRIAITRAVARSDALEAVLRASGAEPVHCPTILIQPPADWRPLDAALRALAREGDWVVFTSANAVHAVADRLATLAAGMAEGTRLAAIGDATASALAARIRGPDFLPSRATAEALATELPARAGECVLFPRGDLARDTLPEVLARRGIHVRDVVAYRTVQAPDAGLLSRLLRAAAVDAVVFASPSAIAFASGAIEAIQALGDRAPLIVCIGPLTAAAARTAGIANVVEARTQTVGGIVEALERALASAADAEPAAP